MAHCGIGNGYTGIGIQLAFILANNDRDINVSQLIIVNKRGFAMKFESLLPATLILTLAAGAAQAANQESASSASDAEGPTPIEEIVIETDHGQGLGPGGKDLHFGNHLADPKNDDAELVLQALDEPIPINPSAEQDELAAELNEKEEPTPEDVVTLEHEMTKRE